jgi:hypothetical protein
VRAPLCWHGRLMILGLHDFEPQQASCACTFLEGPFAAGKHDAMLVTEGRSWHVQGEAIDVGLRAIVAHVEQAGVYDGVYGFSQGSCMLTLLSDASVWRACGGSDATFPPWRFVLVGCGTDYLIGRPGAPTISSSPLALPSLHVAGKRDGILDQSLSLARRYADATVLQHDDGHAIPIALSPPEHPLRTQVERFVLEQTKRARMRWEPAAV